MSVLLLLIMSIYAYALKSLSKFESGDYKGRGVFPRDYLSSFELNLTYSIYFSKSALHNPNLTILGGFKVTCFIHSY